MKTLLVKWFIDNWQRKYFSLFIAIVAWFVINHSLTSTKTLSNIPVRIVALPSNKTIEGMQSNGLMAKTVSLTFIGNKTALESLNPSAVEVVINAEGKPDEWMETITKKHLSSLEPDLDILGTINLNFKSQKLITEKIPIVITQPIGDSPRGYQFLDVWPYHLQLTVRGPEDVVNKLKLKEHKLTFNLNDISKADLDACFSQAQLEKGDIISFHVPTHWKEISLPSLCETPLQIDDELAKLLRIDFVKYDLLPLGVFLPITLFFPPKQCTYLNPATCSIEQNEMIKKVNELTVLNEPLQAKGVSKLFLQIVRDMIQLQVIVVPNSDGSNTLKWSVQFVNPRILEDEYVATLKAKTEASFDENNNFEPIFKEIYWRNRFRNYMNRFELFTASGSKLDLSVELEKTTVMISKHE